MGWLESAQKRCEAVANGEIFLFTDQQFALARLKDAMDYIECTTQQDDPFWMIWLKQVKEGPK